MTFYMDGHARELLGWLKERYDQEPESSFPIADIADGLGWTYGQTRHAIDYVRKDLDSSTCQITCSQEGHVWRYKIPTVDDAEIYAIARTIGIAVLVANVVFLVRKGRVEWGDRPNLVSAQTHLLAALEEVTEMVPAVSWLVSWAMRPIHENSFLG